MNPHHLEALTKAAQCADLLVQDLGEAHRLAARHLPILAILLGELLGQVTQIRDRLAELHSTGVAARGGAPPPRNGAARLPSAGDVHTPCIAQAPAPSASPPCHDPGRTFLDRPSPSDANRGQCSVLPASRPLRADEQNAPAKPS